MSARYRLQRFFAGTSAHLHVALAVLPVGLLVAYWIGGEPWLTYFALTGPLAVALVRLLHPSKNAAAALRDSATGLMLRPGFDAALEDTFEATSAGDLKSACLLVEIDEAETLAARHGEAALDRVIQSTADRIIGAVRPGDHVARFGDARLAICLAPVRQLDLETTLQIAGRLHSFVEEPVYIDGLTVYVSCSIGFCLRSRAPKGGAMAWCDAAQLALADARVNGPSCIRSYSSDMQTRHDVEATLKQDVLKALDNGEIQAWFQPQINTDTGHVSGFEALARWIHPQKGPVAPGQFLPAIEDQGRMPDLTSTMLRQSLQALVNWDAQGQNVTTVSINLTQQDLCDPKLPDVIAWELDRFDLEARRLCIEILETVVTDTPSDIVVHNLQRLHRLGCAIDLDDYGTGHASIAAIKRFPIRRIKIDRSFVMKADQDPDQQRLVAALLTMAERLDLETLAEGVETVGEHALLAQLGCGYVQGFGIARPMPFHETLPWLQQHAEKIATPPEIKRRMG